MTSLERGELITRKDKRIRICPTPGRFGPNGYGFLTTSANGHSKRADHFLTSVPSDISSLWVCQRACPVSSILFSSLPPAHSVDGSVIVEYTRPVRHTERVPVPTLRYPVPGVQGLPLPRLIVPVRPRMFPTFIEYTGYDSYRLPRREPIYRPPISTEKQLPATIDLKHPETKRRRSRRLSRMPGQHVDHVMLDQDEVLRRIVNDDVCDTVLTLLVLAHGVGDVQ